MRPTPLHIHCGDCAADQARRAALPGDILVWRDSAAVGPCALDPGEHRRLRGEWWHVDPAGMQDPAALSAALAGDRPLILWFGPDPWEQISLLELLAGLPAEIADVELVPLERGVGMIAPAALAQLLARRRPAPERAALRRLWADFCADDRSHLQRAASELRGHPQLPHLAAALGRVLADRRDRLTELRVRALVRGGVHDVPTLMQRLRALEAPNHGAWYGDSIVTRLRDAALASA